jgi:hypothetical protein
MTPPELSTKRRELSTWEGWDPVPEWDGWPPEDEPAEEYRTHHHASMQGKIAVAAQDGDPAAAMYEFGGF